MWIDKQEADLAKPDGLEKVPCKTLADAIDKYVKTSHKQIGRTKTQVLNTIKNEYDISSMHSSNIDSQTLVAFVEELNACVSPRLRKTICLIWEPSFLLPNRPLPSGEFDQSEGKGRSGLVDFSGWPVDGINHTLHRFSARRAFDIAF